MSDWIEELADDIDLNEDINMSTADMIREAFKKQQADWVCVGCGARFKHIPHDDGVEYCTPCATVQAQAGRLATLEAEIEKLHSENIRLQRNWVPLRYQSAEAKATP